MFRFGQHAGFVFAEYTVAIARNKLVDEIAQHSWQDAPNAA